MWKKKNIFLNTTCAWWKFHIYPFEWGKRDCAEVDFESFYSTSQVKSEHVFKLLQLNFNESENQEPFI